MTLETYEELSELLGLDLDELTWQDLAICAGGDTNQHYDEYEADDNVARMTDEKCLSCPVMAQCLQRGIDNNEWGVWGAVYLTSGKVDKNRNAHKTKKVWDAIREKIGNAAI